MDGITTFARASAILLLSYCLVVGLIYFNQRDLMFPAPQEASKPFETVHVVEVITSGPDMGKAVREDIVDHDGNLVPIADYLPARLQKGEGITGVTFEMVNKSDLEAPSANTPPTPQDEAKTAGQPQESQPAGNIVAANGASTVKGWFLPPRNKNIPVVVFFHGNAGKLEYRANWAYARFKDEYGVLLAGYRGYEGEKGEPSEAGLMDDARAQIKWLLNEGYTNLVLQGESLGTGIAVRMAAEFPVKAVILEAPYDSMENVARYHYPLLPVGLLLSDKIDSTKYIDKINAPLFVIHGINDQVVPVSLGLALYNAAKEPKEAHWIKGGTHVNLYEYDAYDLIQKFLNNIAPSRTR